jgi:hypothetical protein
MNFYSEYSLDAGEQLVSHISGLRLAPNVVVLPKRLIQGRVASDDCAQLVKEASPERAVPRGRSRYDKPVEAAKYFLRTEAGETGDLRLVAVGLYDRDWKVVFSSGDKRQTVWMTREDTGIFRYKCCAAEQSAKQGLRLVGCRTESDLGALRAQQLIA